MYFALSIDPWSKAITEFTPIGDDLKLDGLAVDYEGHKPYRLQPEHRKQLCAMKPKWLTWAAFLKGDAARDFLCQCAEQNHYAHVDADQDDKLDRPPRSNPELGIVIDMTSRPQFRFPRVSNPLPRISGGVSDRFKLLAAATAAAFIIPLAVENAGKGIPNLHLDSSFSMAAMAASPERAPAKAPASSGFDATVHKCNPHTKKSCLEWIKGLPF